jgi:hypothetical protein
VAKDITDLLQVDTDSNNANWWKLSKNINTELADEVHSYINSLTMDGGWAGAMNLAISHCVLAPAPDLGAGGVEEPAPGAGAAAAAVARSPTLTIDPASLASLSANSSEQSQLQERAVRTAAMQSLDQHAPAQ